MNVTRRPVVWLAVVATVGGLLSAVASRGQPPEGPSGVKFATFLERICLPDSRTSGGCGFRPFQARIRVTSKADGGARTIRTYRLDGRRELLLEPGEYQLKPLRFDRTPYPAAPRSRTITVTKGEFSDVIFDYASGFR